MIEFKVGDKVKTPDGLGIVVSYQNFVYVVKVGKEENYYGKGELQK